MNVPNMSHSQTAAELRAIHAQLVRLQRKPDLSSDDEQLFDALTAKFDELDSHRKRLERAGELARDPAGHGLRLESGAAQTFYDETPGDPLRSRAMRTIDRSVQDGTMAARDAETIENLCRTGTPQSQAWAQRWAAATADPHYLAAFIKRAANPTAGHTLWSPQEAEAWRVAAAVQHERAMDLADVSGGFPRPGTARPGDNSVFQRLHHTAAAGVPGRANHFRCVACDLV